MPSLGFRDQKLLYIFSEKNKVQNTFLNTLLYHRCAKSEKHKVSKFCIYLNPGSCCEQNDYIFRINDIYLLGKTLRNRDKNLKFGEIES